MWPFSKRKGSSPRPQLAAELLVGITGELGPSLAKVLVGEQPNETRGDIQAIALELVVFGLHLTDRIAFSRLGADNRSGFMDALLPLVQAKLHPQVASQFQEMYNLRNTFYGTFPKLYPDKKENLKGTLFWEFGKAMGSVYAKNNPITITEVSMFAMSFLQAIQGAYEEAKVFS